MPFTQQILFSARRQAIAPPSGGSAAVDSMNGGTEHGAANLAQGGKRRGRGGVGRAVVLRRAHDVVAARDGGAAQSDSRERNRQGRADRAQAVRLLAARRRLYP